MLASDFKCCSIPNFVSLNHQAAPCCIFPGTPASVKQPTAASNRALSLGLSETALSSAAPPLLEIIQEPYQAADAAPLTVNAVEARVRSQFTEVLVLTLRNGPKCISITQPRFAYSCAKNHQARQMVALSFLPADCFSRKTLFSKCNLLSYHPRAKKKPEKGHGHFPHSLRPENTPACSAAPPSGYPGL